MIPQQHRRKAGIVAAACAMALPCEGVRRVVYYDPPGIPTVCMGHTGKGGVKGKVYTDAECQALFTADMGAAVDQVESCQPGLPPKVAIAFADAVFNMGPTIACDTQNSTAARMLTLARVTDGDYSPACRQLPRWNKARVAGVLVELGGLTKRRAIEMAVCLQWTQETEAALQEAYERGHWDGWRKHAQMMGGGL
ncbi:MAG: lysozyme [Frateuria sp.]|nr:lysozyme [Frateuria sp.]